MQLNLARIATAITMGLVEFGDESANGPAGYLNLAAPLITLYAAYGTRRIAPLAIGDKSNLTLAPYPDSASQFYTGGPYLYAYAPNNPYIGPVHINFRTTNQGCDHYGILNFSTTLQPICAPSHTFSFDGNLLVFSTPGSFKLCDDRSIIYDTEPSRPIPGHECNIINILQD